MAFFKSFGQNLPSVNISSILDSVSSRVDNLASAVTDATYSVSDQLTELSDQVIKKVQTEEEEAAETAKGGQDSKEGKAQEGMAESVRSKIKRQASEACSSLTDYSSKLNQSSDFGLKNNQSSDVTAEDYVPAQLEWVWKDGGWRAVKPGESSAEDKEQEEKRKEEEKKKEEEKRKEEEKKKEEERLKQVEEKKNSHQETIEEEPEDIETSLSPKENHATCQDKKGQKEDKSNGVHQSDDHSDPPQSPCHEEESRASKKKKKGEAEEEENEVSPEGDGERNETEAAISPASEKEKKESDKKKEKGKEKKEKGKEKKEKGKEKKEKGKEKKEKGKEKKEKGKEKKEKGKEKKESDKKKKTGDKDQSCPDQSCPERGSEEDRSGRHSEPSAQHRASVWDNRHKPTSDHSSEASIGQRWFTLPAPVGYEPEPLAKYGTLDVAFEYDSGEQHLAVTVTAATDIPALKQTGNIAWQVHLVLLPTKKQRAKTGVQRGPCPVFTETFRFSRVEQEALADHAVRFRLYSIRRMKKEKVLGEKVFYLTKLNLQGKMTLPVTLEPGTALMGCGSLVSVSRSAGALSYRSTGDSTPEILLGLIYNSTTGRLSAEVIQGSHFKNTASDKPPSGLFCCIKQLIGGQLYIMRDTYVKLTMLDSKGKEMSKCKTSVCRGQPNPSYKETFVFQVALFQLSEVSLVVSVYSRRSSMKARERVGWVSLGFNSTGEEQQAHWSQMKEAEGQQEEEYDGGS